MSYKTEVVADPSGQWCGNGLAFASEAEAEAYARDLYSRWSLVTRYRVIRADQIVNSAWTGNGLQAVAYAGEGVTE